MEIHPLFATALNRLKHRNDSTVVFKLNQADSAIISKLTYQSLSILDSTVVKENGGTDAEDAASTDTAQEYLNSTSAGTGMYVMTSYIPNEQVVLEKIQIIGQNLTILRNTF